jgi:hypothetical protein
MLRRQRLEHESAVEQRHVVHSPNKDFSFHIRGRFQHDWGWFAPDESLEPRGWHDGAQMRRARIGTQGTVWETVNWTTEWDFAEGGIVRGTDNDGRQPEWTRPRLGCAVSMGLVIAGVCLMEP